MKKILSLFLAFGLVFAIAGAPLSVQRAHADCPIIQIRSWNGCEPTIETGGVISTDKYSAVVSASVNSLGADYNSEDAPRLSIEYGVIYGGTFDRVTEVKIIKKTDNPAQSFLLTGLEDGQKYAYRAILTWTGGTKRGEVKTFIAKKQITPTQTTTNTQTSTNTQIPYTGNTTTQPVDNTPIYSADTNTSVLGGLFGGTKTTTKTTSLFSNTAELSGFRLAIDNGQTQVHQGDTVTIKVRYENNNTKSADNSTVDIYLAPQYSFDSTTKGIYDRIDNKVSIDLRSFPGGAFGTAVITAKATGKAGDLDQAVSQAALRTPKVTLKVTDIDEYVAGSGSSSSNSVLGASVSGSGFLPSTILGWLLVLIILAAIVIVGRRYFIKKDY